MLRQRRCYVKATSNVVIRTTQPRTNPPTLDNDLPFHFYTAAAPPYNDLRRVRHDGRPHSRPYVLIHVVATAVGQSALAGCVCSLL